MSGYAAAKVAVSAVTDKKSRNIIGGIIIGIIIVIIAPIAILMGVLDVSKSIDWNSPEMQQYLIENMSDEQKAQVQHFNYAMQAIEDEITAQGLDVDSIKAQVIFLCTLFDRVETETLYSDFVSCFANGADDETIFANLAAKFDVSLIAEEKKKILLLAEKAIASQTVPPSALHNEIGNMLAGDTTQVIVKDFTSPFHGLNWKDCLTSDYGNRVDPFTREKVTHSGIDLAVDAGTQIYPVKPGKVLFVRNDENGYGKYLVIYHGGGQASLYAHCSAILVTEGTEVTTDMVIALVGSSGRSTGNHLHLEIILDGKPVNPKKYLEVTPP